MCGIGESRYTLSSNSRDGPFRDAVRAGDDSLGGIRRRRIAGMAPALGGSGVSAMFITANAWGIAFLPQTLAMGSKIYNSPEQGVI